MVRRSAGKNQPSPLSMFSKTVPAIKTSRSFFFRIGLIICLLSCSVKKIVTLVLILLKKAFGDDILYLNYIFKGGLLL
jgi:hypothetical protein